MSTNLILPNFLLFHTNLFSFFSSNVSFPVESILSKKTKMFDWDCCSAVPKLISWSLRRTSSYWPSLLYLYTSQVHNNNAKPESNIDEYLPWRKLVWQKWLVIHCCYQGRLLEINICSIDLIWSTVKSSLTKSGKVSSGKQNKKFQISKVLGRTLLPAGWKL